MDDGSQDIPKQVDIGRWSEELVTSIQDGHIQMRSDMENLLSAWQLRIEGELQKQLVAKMPGLPMSFIRSIDKEIRISAPGENGTAIADPAQDKLPAASQPGKISAPGENGVETADQVALQAETEAASSSPARGTANPFSSDQDLATTEADELALKFQNSLDIDGPDRELDLQKTKVNMDGDKEECHPDPQTQLKSTHMHPGAGTQQFFDDLVREAASSRLLYLSEHLGVSSLLHRGANFVRKKHLPPQVSRTCSYIVKSRWFTFLVTTLILLNSALVAVSADEFAHACWRHFDSGGENKVAPLTPAWMDSMDIAFTILFSLELACRLGDEELQFFTSDDLGWNVFDLLVLVSAWIEVAISLSNVRGANVSFLRVFRILRVLRSLRIVKVLRMMREMRLILLCLIHAITPLFWALVCLSMIIYLFAINFMSGVSAFLIWGAGNSQYAESAAELYSFFGGFTRCFVSLLYVITGGEDWAIFYRALSNMEEFSWMYKWFLIAYIVIMIFGVLNVITAIFVECSLSKAQADRELSVAAENHKTKAVMGELMKLFHSIDDDSSNTLTWEEWSTFVARKDAKSLLALLGLDAGKSAEIFNLVDVDESNEIDMQEFVLGCMQLRGGAKNVDIETMLRANRKLMLKNAENIKRVDQNIQRFLEEASAKSDSILTEILSRLDNQGNTRRD